MLNKFFILILSLSLLAVACQQETSISAEKIDKELRVVSLSGFLTETLYFLGHGDKIVGRDVTSTYPKTAVALPNLGHVSKLNPEALLELKPDIIFVEEKNKNQAQILSQLEKSGIKVISISTTTHLNNSLTAARQIMAHLPTKKERLSGLSVKIEKDSLALTEFLSKNPADEKVLFIYARGAGTLLAGGKNTSAGAAILHSGAQNAVTAFEDFKPLTPESLLASQPDVVLMFDSGLASLEGKKGLTKVPGMAKTPALINERIITMDGHYLTAFGPRAGEAMLELAQRIAE